VQGLKLTKDGGEWVKTMLPPSSASEIARRARLKLSEETGGVEGKLTITFTGLQALRRRVEERNEDDTDRRTFLEDEAKEYIPVAADVVLTNKPDWANSDAPLVAEFDIKVPGWASSAGRRALMPLGLFGETEKHLFEHADRLYPIYFEFPFQESDDLTIELPPGWRVNSVPPQQDDEGRVLSYVLKVENLNGNLHITRKFGVDILLLEAKYYPALRGFIQKVRSGDEEQIVLQPGTAVTSN
jgi:hypothetical protein